MKSSRLRGMALASGAFLALGSVQAQVTYLRPSPVVPPSQYVQAALPAGPAPLVGPTNNPWNSSTPAYGTSSLIPAPPASVLQYPAIPTSTGSVGSVMVHPSQQTLVYPNYGAPQAVGGGTRFPSGSYGPTTLPAPTMNSPGQGVMDITPIQPNQLWNSNNSMNSGGFTPGMSATTPMSGPATNGMNYPNYPVTPYGSSPCGDTSCGVPCCAPVNCGWYLGMYSMIMSRHGQNHFTYSFDTANEANQFTDAKDAEFFNDAGFAVSLGHCFNCGQNAFEVVYWGWFPSDASTYTYGTSVAGSLNGIFNWDSLTYNGANAGTWVNNADVHAIFRSSEAHNIELNLVQIGNAGICAGPWQYSLLAGVRYFRFQDTLRFASDTTDAVIDGDASEIYYDVETENHLLGFQLGGVGNYSFGPRFSVNGGTKFGLFGSHMEHHSFIGGPAGVAVINNGPNTGMEWNVNSTKDGVSFLGEMFLGGTYAFGCRWSVSGGYRVVAVTSVALPTDQIYPDLRGINDAASIESNGSLILHGAYVGAQFMF